MAAPAKIGIVTVSDRASAGVYADEGGPAIVDYFARALTSSWQAVTRVIPDERAGIAETLIEHYLAAFPHLDPDAFRTSYCVIGAQRSTRILGTFARLKLRDSKAGYLRHIPRVWRWLGQDLAHPALAPVRIWFDRHVPAEARGVPPALAA